MVFRVFVIFVFSVCAFECFAGYPVPPKTKERLFYIQRNHNSNTIVYDAVFDSLGFLNAEKPIDVYWLRYDEQGQRMELRSIEKAFAYGVSCAVSDSSNQVFRVELVAKKNRVFLLKQDGPFDARIYTVINGELRELDHMYIFADNSGWWPEVLYVELFGRGYEGDGRRYEKVMND